MLVMMGGPLVTASPHEICEAMHHGCAKIDTLASCCCGAQSERHLSILPSDRTDAVNSLHVIAGVVTAVVPAATVLFVHERPRLFPQPPDFCILFGDLRV